METGKVMRAYRRIHGVPDTAFWSIGIGPAMLRLLENGSYPQWDLKTVEKMKKIIDNYSERSHKNAGAQQED